MKGTPYERLVMARVHHYGFATHNLERTAETFRTLGHEVTGPISDPLQQVDICFISCQGQCPIELVCDCGMEGPTRGLISKAGNCLYHICYEVDDIDDSVKALRRMGFLVKQKPVKALAFGERRVAWLYNRDIGLIELLERQSAGDIKPCTQCP